jgi:glycosyltransferase involved in cell wall biosynthesis
VTAAANSQHVPRHRITYWTGIWEPAREAISKEVAWLRGALAPGSPVVSFTPQRSALDWTDRVLRLNFNRWYGLRAAAAVLEPQGRITHVFGGIGTSDHFLYLLGRRPLLFTVVIGGTPSRPPLYARVGHFVAESGGLAAALIGAGVEPSRIDVIYPAVDLERFEAASAPPSARFTLLFASSPADASEIEPRGLPLLVELARARPDVEVVVLWRQWGDVAAAQRTMNALRPPPNCQIVQRDATDMRTVYRDVHAVTCFFAASVGKAAPNSVIEALAMGRPALLADTCGIADLVTRWQAGAVAARSVDALAAGLDELRSDYANASRQARRLAEQEFDARRALVRYEALYQRLLGES